MENKKFDKSLNDLICIYKKNYSDVPKKELLEINIEIINKFFNFLIFLENKNFDYYELPYILYWEIIFYIEELYKNWNKEYIEKILIFLDEKLQNENENINTLIQIWVFENMDKLNKNTLVYILELMPKYSKNIFMKHYSHYLK